MRDIKKRQLEFLDWEMGAFFHPGRHELQYGENNYDFIISAVEKAGYTGAMGLEYFPRLAPDKSLTEAKQLYEK